MSFIILNKPSFVLKESYKMYVVHLMLFIPQIYLTKSSSLVAPSRLLVTRIGPCLGTNLPVSISEMSLTRKEFDYTLSGEFNISADVANGWCLKATMQKCHDIRNLDTCDHYKSLTVTRSGCDSDDEGDQLLQNYFFQHVTPRLGCPLQAGVYQISNYPFLTEESDLTAAESKISTSVFGYTYRLDGFDEDYQKILCVDAYLQLIYVRKHDWIGKQNVKPVKTRNNTVNDIAHQKHNEDAFKVKNDDSKQSENKDESDNTKYEKKIADTFDDKVVEHDEDTEENENEESKQNTNDSEEKNEIVKHDVDDAEVKNEGNDKDDTDDQLTT